MSAMVELMDAWLAKRYPCEPNSCEINKSNIMKITITSFEFTPSELAGIINPAEIIEAITDNDFNDLRVKLMRTREQREQPALSSKTAIAPGVLKVPFIPEQKTNSLKGKPAHKTTKTCAFCQSTYEGFNSQIYCSDACKSNAKQSLPSGSIIAKGIETETTSAPSETAISSQPLKENAASKAQLIKSKPNPQVKSNIKSARPVAGLAPHQPKTFYYIRCRHCNERFKSLSPSTPFCSAQCSDDHKEITAAAEQITSQQLANDESDEVPPVMKNAQAKMNKALDKNQIMNPKSSESGHKTKKTCLSCGSFFRGWDEDIYCSSKCETKAAKSKIDLAVNKFIRATTSPNNSTENLTWYQRKKLEENHIKEEQDLISSLKDAPTIDLDELSKIRFPPENISI